MSTFASGTTIAIVASLIGDVARANILTALLSGRALTAGELAAHAGVSAQTTSGHLAKLLESGLITGLKQGRHRYYRLASRSVAEVLEVLMTVSDLGPPRHRPIGPRDAAMRRARTCYDHMAGRLAVSLAEALQEGGLVVLSDEGGVVTEAGEREFSRIGLDLGASRGSRRPLCRTCLDWSERRFHIGGRLGAVLLDFARARKWVADMSDSRALRITRAGERGFADLFGVVNDALDAGQSRPAETRPTRPAL